MKRINQYLRVQETDRVVCCGQLEHEACERDCMPLVKEACNWEAQEAMLVASTSEIGES